MSRQVYVDKKISFAWGSVVDVFQMFALFGGFPLSLPLLLDLCVSLPSIRLYWAAEQVLFLLPGRLLRVLVCHFISFVTTDARDPMESNFNEVLLEGSYLFKDLAYNCVA
jgi:hypothetical protein